MRKIQTHDSTSSLTIRGRRRKAAFASANAAGSVPCTTASPIPANAAPARARARVPPSSPWAPCSTPTPTSPRVGRFVRISLISSCNRNRRTFRVTNGGCEGNFDDLTVNLGPVHVINSLFCVFDRRKCHVGDTFVCANYFHQVAKLESRFRSKASAEGRKEKRRTHLVDGDVHKLDLSINLKNLSHMFLGNVLCQPRNANLGNYRFHCAFRATSRSASALTCRPAPATTEASGEATSSRAAAIGRARSSTTGGKRRRRARPVKKGRGEGEEGGERWSALEHAGKGEPIRTFL